VVMTLRSTDEQRAALFVGKRRAQDLAPGLWLHPGIFRIKGGGIIYRKGANRPNTLRGNGLDFLVLDDVLVDR
jgi:hypothetical protein